MDGSGELFQLDYFHVKPAGESLAESFFYDPQSMHFFPDPSDRANRLKYGFEFSVRYGLRYGEVFATSPDMEGIAVWIQSEYSVRTVPRILKCGGLSTLMKVGWTVYKRQQPVEDFIHAEHMRLAPFPHYYLDLLGVVPEHRQTGLAGRLLKPMFRKLDRNNLPIYLNTMLEKNVAMYQRYGFKVLSRDTIPGTDIPHWGLLREPA
jgi:GNAT superfamily N-acetyltransferase